MLEQFKKEWKMILFVAIASVAFVYIVSVFMLAV